MTGHPDTAPEIARARIAAVRDAAKALCLRTGGDPAECVFELIAAAILIIHEARPIRPPSEMISDVASSAAECVDHWFADELQRFRCRHG
jgi:hypothetical protein